MRLALEDAGADYIDVARSCEDIRSGVATVDDGLDAARNTRPPFAPPYLRAGDIEVSHVANILQFLGPRLNLAPSDESLRYWWHGLQLTLTDFVAEIHDTHHPIGTNLYYEQQTTEARRRAEVFIDMRLPQFLDYFEHILTHNPSGDNWLVSNACSTVDLSLFHIITGMQYAFPNAMADAVKDRPRLLALANRVAERPRVAAYLASDRRMAFNNDGVFRHYPELDASSD